MGDCRSPREGIGNLLETEAAATKFYRRCGEGTNLVFETLLFLPRPGPEGGVVHNTVEETRFGVGGHSHKIVRKDPGGNAGVTLF